MIPERPQKRTKFGTQCNSGDIFNKMEKSLLLTLKTLKVTESTNTALKLATTKVAEKMEQKAEQEPRSAIRAL